MNAPVKFSTPAKIKRPWLLVAIIAALLAVAAVISLYEFSPAFRIAVGYKLVDDEFLTVKGVRTGDVVVSRYEKRRGYGNIFATSDGLFLSIPYPEFYLETHNRFKLTDDELCEVKNYILGEVITEEAMSDMLTEWCRSWWYSQAVRLKKHGREENTYNTMMVKCRCEEATAEVAHFSVNAWYMPTVFFTLDRATGEIAISEGQLPQR